MMYDFKAYITSVIITSVILQLCSLLLKNTGYNKIFENICSLIMIAVLFSPVFSSGKIMPVITLNTNTTDYSYNKINNVFADNLEKSISDDIEKNGFGKCEVFVQTDLSCLKIDIYPYVEIHDSSILKKYIEDKYCTARDEVCIHEYY